MEQPAPNDPLIGANIGNYEVKRKLGEGGMGSVYMAEHPLIGKQVALKVLHAEFASNEDVVTRFFNEARAVNNIQHPNIVDIVDYGVIPHSSGNMVYFIMEFLDGISLADLVRSEAPLAPERSLAVCLQIADALAASHNAGIIHRDLKPDNVILITRGRERDFVKVLDFGIAKLTGDQSGSRRTRTGIVMGTPAYMSPEQCEGRGNIDFRTDIYALGILLYEMITGRVPFTGEGYGEVLVQHLTQMPARPSTIRGVIPPHVEAIVMKALEKRPDARYPTMEEFMKALADPVGYVESHGGLNGFLGAQLVASPTAPPLEVTAARIAPLTPAPGSLSAIAPGTPAPGTMQMNSPAVGYVPTPPPGYVAPVPGTPTTLGGGAGQFEHVPGGSRSRLPLIVGVAVLAVAIGLGTFFITRGGGGGDSSDEVAENDVNDDGDSTDPDVAAGTDGETDENGTATDKKDGETGTTGETTDKKDGETGTTAETADKKDGETDKPPEPVMVKIKIASNPKGAKVFVNDERRARGKTPYTLEIEQGDKPITITLKRSGFYDREEKITPKGNSDFDWNLKRKRGGTSGNTNSGNTSSNSGNSGNTGSIGGAETMTPTFGED